MSQMATERPAADTCRICRTPARDKAYYCDTCRDKFDQTLGDITWLADELDVTITRQKGVNLNGGGSRSSETPIPWHDKAAEAKRDLQALLVSWVQCCRDSNVRGVPAWTPRPPERPTLASLARWLLHCTRGLALTDFGSDAYDEITAAVDQCRRIVFWKRRDRIYLGPCGLPVKDEDDQPTLEKCPGDIYAEEGDPTGACDDCGEKVTVVVRQAKLNEDLDGHLCTPGEIARFAVLLGLQVPRDSVRKKVNHWSEKGIIGKRGEALNGDPLFKYGEVRPLLYSHFSEKVKS